MWISAKVTHLAEMGRVKVPFICRSGGMADALASGASDRKVVWVQVPSPAPKKRAKQSLVRFFVLFTIHYSFFIIHFSVKTNDFLLSSFPFSTYKKLVFTSFFLLPVDCCHSRT